MGLDLEALRLEVEKLVGRGSDQKMTGRIPYTPRVKKVLSLAAKEAKSLHYTEYLELEDADGQTIFIARTSRIKFWEHRKTPAAEP